MYSMSFWLLLEAVKPFNRDMFEGLEAGSCSSPYITSQIAELSDSEPDMLTLQDMSHYAKLLSGGKDAETHMRLI